MKIIESQRNTEPWKRLNRGMTITQKPAETSVPLSNLIKNRWSPRLFDKNHSMSTEEIKSLGEAFRWAPSSSNQQPWHVVFLTRDSELFRNIASTGLTGFNQAWAPHASVLAVVLARKLEKGKARNQAATYFDVGLASMQMVLEAESMGLRSHFMGGILHDQISTILGADDFWVTCVVAIGKQAGIEGASPEMVEREVAVRSRFLPEHAYSINERIS